MTTRRTGADYWTRHIDQIPVPQVDEQTEATVREYVRDTCDDAHVILTALGLGEGET